VKRPLNECLSTSTECVGCSDAVVFACTCNPVTSIFDFLVVKYTRYIRVFVCVTSCFCHHFGADVLQYFLPVSCCIRHV